MYLPAREIRPSLPFLLGLCVFEPSSIGVRTRSKSSASGCRASRGGLCGVVVEGWFRRALVAAAGWCCRGKPYMCKSGVTLKLLSAPLPGA
jgi:hypothetical protein